MYQFLIGALTMYTVHFHSLCVMLKYQLQWFSHTLQSCVCVVGLSVLGTESSSLLCCHLMHLSVLTTSLKAGNRASGIPGFSLPVHW